MTLHDSNLKWQRKKMYCLAVDDRKFDGAPTVEVTSDSPIELQHNLFSSLCDDGMHRPALDIDLPCELVPSTNPGHFHLYIDKALTLEQYTKVVDVLSEVGILGPMHPGLLRERSMTCLRPPGYVKTEKASDSDFEMEPVQKSRLKKLLGLDEDF